MQLAVRAAKPMHFRSMTKRESTLNKLLTELDGFGTNIGIIVLASRQLKKYVLIGYGFIFIVGIIGFLVLNA